MRRKAIAGVLAGTAMLATVAAVAWVGRLWYVSLVPATYSVMDYGTID